jgi:hypothetical protein
MKAWLKRVWKALVYAHDPEAHRLIQAVLDRVDALARQAHLPVMVVPTEAPREMRHDCGHVTVTYATNGDGRTECDRCYTARWANYRRPEPPPTPPSRQGATFH